MDGTQLLAKYAFGVIIIIIFWFFLLIMYIHVYRKEGEIAMKVCSTNWSNEWSNFVCQSLGFTEVKTTSFKTSDPTDNSTSYLKLKDDSNLNSSKNLIGFLEQSTISCDTLEIKCSSKHCKIYKK